MSLGRTSVEQALGRVLDRVPEAEIRLVGTASSVLRGIDLPAHDIDLLFRHRDGLDAWFHALAADATVEMTPAWLPEASQYFARLVVSGVTVELSTVEIENGSDTNECFGPGPWRYFDAVPVLGGSVPAVATELRLVTEIARQRPDRFQPIIEHLRGQRCDADLIRRGLANIGAGQAAIDQVVAWVASDRV